LIQRRHWNVTNVYTCVLCPGGHHEDRDHLFFNCQFSGRVWNYLQINWEQGDNMMHIASSARRQFHRPFFAEVVFLACWNIWKV
jgi:hypothetical protein